MPGSRFTAITFLCTSAAALAQISSAKDDGILLLDEPTVALDLAYQLELGDLLRERQRLVAITIAVSTHDLNFAASLCRTLVLLKDGKVLYRIDAPGEAVTLYTGVGLSNGIGFSPDGRYLYHVDSAINGILVHEIDQDGEVMEASGATFAQMS